jgi:hypothetical protein
VVELALEGSMRLALPLFATATVALVLSTVAVSSLHAQEITGAIGGSVTDPSGAAIPGVSVSARNVGTNATQTVVTNESGVYTFSLLQIGTYEVTAELSGFKRFVRTGLALSVNDRLRVDVKLETGNIDEAITVVGQTPVIHVQDSTIGTLIPGSQVERMPLNGRNVIQLVAMQPGVSSTLPSTMFPGLGQLTNVYVNGSRASQNNWMVDGVDNNDAGSNLSVINNVNVDAVAEVNILRSNYSAEFGRNAGGQVNVITKAGANDFHGSLFEFMRDDRLDASPFFGTFDRDGDGKKDPLPLDYNNFGGTFGGRVIPDRLFFFWGEEFRRIRTIRGNGHNDTRTPTDLQRRGNFSELSTPIVDPLTGQPFPGNIIPSSRLDPVAVQLASHFPQPNADPNVLGGRRNFSAETPSKRDFRQELLRVDYRLSDTQTAYVRFINDTIPSTEPFGEVFGTNRAQFPNIASTETDNPGRSLLANWTWIASPTILLEVGYMYARGAIFSSITGDAGRDVAAPKVFSGNPGDGLLPGINFGTTEYGGWDFFGPYDNTYGSHRARANMTKAQGAHSLKAGVLFSWEFKNENNAAGTNGLFTFPGTSSATYASAGDAFADFMLGRAASYTETNIDIASHLRFQSYELYAQDDWRIAPRVTLNLGVRYSLIMSPTDTNNVLTNFDPSRFDPSRAYRIDASGQRVAGTGDPLNGIIVAGQSSPYGERVTRTDKTNIGPRVGFAWDLTGDGKTSVRGGYGLYYDRTLVGTALQNAFVNPPFAFQAVFNSSLASAPLLANPQAGTARNNEVLVPALIALDPNYKTPRTHQFSVGMQRELPGRMALEVAYVGGQGRNLLQTVDINKTPPGTSGVTNQARPFIGYSTISMRQTTAAASYNSLQTSLQKRFERGLQFTLNYTWSKAVSDSSSDRNAGDTVQDPSNLKADRAVTAYDRTHIFGAHYVWELPFLRAGVSRLLYNVAGGWDIAGSTRMYTGLPLTVTTTTNFANAFNATNHRPDLVGDPDGPGTVEQFFDTAAFQNGAANSYGNAPRSVVRLPWGNVTDLSLFKNFDTGTRVNIQFRAEAFNVFNRTTFTAAGTMLGNATFGRLTTAAEPRLVQLGIRATF